MYIFLNITVYITYSLNNLNNILFLEQPNAEIVSSKENETFYRECKSDVGNPPPLAYWSKHGKKIGDFGYKTKKLTIDNITKGEAAIYSCNVKSHNLTDQENITLGKKPDNEVVQ